MLKTVPPRGDGCGVRAHVVNMRVNRPHTSAVPALLHGVVGAVGDGDGGGRAPESTRKMLAEVVDRFRHLWPRAAVLAGVLLSFTSSLTIDFSQGPQPSIQPRDAAFVIWGFIFPALAWSGATQAGTHTFPKKAAVMTTGSLVVTCAWAISASGPSMGWLSALLLGLSAVLAWVAVLACPLVDGWDPASWGVQAALGVYAGWLTAATSINVAIADSRFDEPLLLVATACIAAAVCAAARRPIPCVAVFWAALMQPSGYAVTAMAIAVAGATVAGVRVTHMLGSGAQDSASNPYASVP